MATAEYVVHLNTTEIQDVTHAVLDACVAQPHSISADDGLKPIAAWLVR